MRLDLALHAYSGSVARLRLLRRKSAKLLVDPIGIHGFGADVYYHIAVKDGEFHMPAGASETVRERELAPLTKINDNYEKIVLSLQPGMDASYDGIKSLNLIDWLLQS